VPLVENNEHLDPGADYFVEKYINELLDKDSNIDCILLACTHYPLLIPKIMEKLPENVSILGQGDIVADSLVLYLGNHPEIESMVATEGKKSFYTSGDEEVFNRHATIFFGSEVISHHITLKIR